MQKEKVKNFVIFFLCVIFLSHSVEKKELVNNLKNEISLLEERLAVDFQLSRAIDLVKGLNIYKL